MAKAAKMVDPKKTNDEAPTGDAGAGVPEAPAETAELQSIEPSAEEQSGPVPEPEAVEPRSAEPLADVQSGPVNVRYHVLAPVFVNGSFTDPKGRKDLYVFAAPGLEGNALKLAPEGEAGTATG